MPPIYTNPKIDYSLVQKYWSGGTQNLQAPYPWYPSGDKPGTATVYYARMLLDALTNDDRRHELRRVWRFYKKHLNGQEYWRSVSYWMLVEACYRLYEVLPYSLLCQHLKTPNGPAQWTI